MKRKILTMLFTVFLFVVLAVTSFAAYDIGDVDNNGMITAEDARLTLRNSASLENLTPEQIAAADVDKSGEITAGDARTILRVSADLETFESANGQNSLYIEPGVLNVAVCADNPPFCYMKDGKLTGVDIDVAEKLAASLGLKLKLHNMPADKLINSVKNNECDVALAKVASGRNFNSQGAFTAVYYTNPQYIYYSNYSSFNSLEKLKGANIGVIKGSVADLMITQDIANGELGNAKIVRYTRFVDAVNALNNKSISVFIGDADFKLCNVNRYAGYYVKEDSCIVSSAAKAELVTKLSANLKSTNVNQLVQSYCPPVKSDSKIISEVSKLTLAPGATAVIEVTLDSFYGNDSLVIKSSSYPNTSYTEYNGKYYLKIMIPKNAKSGKIVLSSNKESGVTYTINVTVSKSASAKYNFGTESYCPDLGVYSGVTPEEIIIDTENKTIAYLYNAEKLYNAGMKDTEDYDKYIELMEKQGFIADSYLTDDYSYYMLYLINSKIGKEAAYAEYYYSDGTYLYLTAVAIIVTYEF